MKIEPLSEHAVRVVGIALPRLMLEEPSYLEGIGESVAVLPHFLHHEGFSQMHIDGDEVSWTITWRPLAD